MRGTKSRELMLGVLVVTAVLTLAGNVHAQGASPAAADSHGTSLMMMWLLWSLAPVGALAGLVFAWRFFHYVKKCDPGDELMQENEQSRKAADQSERSAKIREELQRLGVTKVDLGFKAVKDDIYRAEDGRLVARGAEGETSLEEHLARFARDNPELLPARIPGGSGASGAQRSGVPGGGGVDLDKIKPGMDPEELARARREIAQAISHSVQGT